MLRLPAPPPFYDQQDQAQFRRAVEDFIRQMQTVLPGTRLSEERSPIDEAGDLKDDVVGSGTIEDGAVTTPKIDTAAVIAEKIADEAVEAAKLADEAVVERTIAALAVSEAKIAVAAVTNTKLGASAVTTDKINDAAVESAKIADAAVGTTKIADDSITTPKLVAQSITVAKLFVTNFDNLAEDPGIERGGSTWLLNSGWATDGDFPRSGEVGLQFTGATETALNASRVDCAPGDQFYIEGWLAGVNGADGSATAFILWRDASGLGLSFSFTPSANSTGAYNKVAAIVTAPANAVYAQAGFAVSSRTTGTWFADDIYLRRATSGEIIVDGTLTASKIATDAITADKILAGSVTTVKLDALAVTAEKIAASAVTTEKLNAGAVTAEKITAESITAAKLYISNFDNLVEDPGAERGGATWEFDPGWGVDTSANARSGAKYFAFSGAAAGDALPTGMYLDCAPGDKFYVEAYVRAHSSTDGTLTIGVTFFDKDRIALTVLGVQTTSGDDTYQRKSATVTAPANAVYCQFRLRVDDLTTGAFRVDDCYMRRAVDGQLIVDGSILANHIAASAVTTDKLAADSVVAAKIDVSDLSAISAQFTGTLTIQTSGQLQSSGASTFDGTMNSRAGFQIGVAGASFNQSATKRLVGDNPGTGTLILKVLEDGTEGTKAVLGDYTASDPTALTDKSDTSWADTSEQVQTSTEDTWVAGTGECINELATTTDLPTHDGFVKVHGQLRAETITGGDPSEMTVLGRLMAYVDTGAGYGAGVEIASVEAGADGDETVNFQASVAVGTGTDITIKVVPEVFVVGDTTGRVTVSFTSAPWNQITWKKSSATNFTRRGLFLGAEDAQPHITFEPLDGTQPTASNLVRGELWYDGDANALKYYDGTSVKTVTAS